MRWNLTRIITYVLTTGLLITGSTAFAQRPGLKKNAPVIIRPRQKLGQPVAPDQERARQLVLLFLRQGNRQEFQAEETTRLLRGRVRESQQIVKQGGPGRRKIEYLSPPALQGDILLVNGGHLLKYDSRKKKIFFSPASNEEMETRTKALMQEIRERRIQVRVVGSEIIAGQNAAIVEIRPVRGGEFFKRFWIDEKTGVRLKIEDNDPQGNAISTSYYTKIDYAPNFEKGEFAPNSLPNVPKEPLLPDTPPLANVQAAQSQVGYTIRQPVVPSGFTLKSIWVTKNAEWAVTILRYSDGVNSFTLFQHPFAGPAKIVPPKENFRMMGGGMAQWVSSDQTFFLIGNLKPKVMKEIADSLR